MQDVRSIVRPRTLAILLVVGILAATILYSLSVHMGSLAELREDFNEQVRRQLSYQARQSQQLHDLLELIRDALNNKETRTSSGLLPGTFVSDSLPSARSSTPAEPPKKKIDGHKIVEALGKDALSTAKGINSLSLEQLVAFLKDKAGVAINLNDKTTEEMVHMLRGRYGAQCKVAGFDHSIRLARIKWELEKSGRLEEAPGGVAFSQPTQDQKNSVQVTTLDGKTNVQRRYLIDPEEFPEVMQQNEDTLKIFSDFLDQLGEVIAQREEQKQ